MDFLIKINFGQFKFQTKFFSVQHYQIKKSVVTLNKYS